MWPAVKHWSIENFMNWNDETNVDDDYYDDDDNKYTSCKWLVAYYCMGTAQSRMRLAQVGWHSIWNCEGHSLNIVQ